MKDLKFAMRQLGKSPGFTCIVVLTLALGIGANTAVFSVLNAVLLRPLPFNQPQNLVAIGEYDTREKADPGTDINSISYLDYVDWRNQNKVFERIAVYTNQGVSTLTDGNGALHVQGESVSADLFPLLGVQPLLGRTFLPNEDNPGNHVVILSHALWQRRFGADRNVVGKTAMLDGQQFEVIGVMPPRFTFPIAAVSAELWVSMSSLRESKDGGSPMTEQRDNDFFECIARLKPNVSIAASAGEHRQHYRKLASTISGLKTAHWREGHSTDQRNDWQHTFGVADVVRDGRLRAAYRLSQRREPFAGAVAFAQSRNKHPCRARRRPLAYY